MIISNKLIHSLTISLSPVNDDKKQTDPHRWTAVKEIAEEELEKLKLC